MPDYFTYDQNNKCYTYIRTNVPNPKKYANYENNVTNILNANMLRSKL